MFPVSLSVHMRWRGLSFGELRAEVPRSGLHWSGLRRAMHVRARLHVVQVSMCVETRLGMQRECAKGNQSTQTNPNQNTYQNTYQKRDAKDYDTDHQRQLMRGIHVSYGILLPWLHFAALPAVQYRLRCSVLDDAGHPCFHLQPLCMSTRLRLHGQRAM